MLINKTSVNRIKGSGCRYFNTEVCSFLCFFQNVFQNWKDSTDRERGPDAYVPHCSPD